MLSYLAFLGSALDEMGGSSPEHLHQNYCSRISAACPENIRKPGVSRWILKHRYREDTWLDAQFSSELSARVPVEEVLAQSATVLTQ